MIWIYTLASVVFISMISLLGLFTLSLKRHLLAKIVNYLVAFAVGALLGGAFIHLIPEAFEKISQPAASLYVLLGIFLFFFLENFLRWRHCHHEVSESHPHPVATLNLIGDGVHNLIDGMVIAAAYMVSIPVGIATTVAVILHEIPQELGDFGVLINAGFSISKALFFNFLSACLAIIGALIVLLLGAHLKDFTVVLLPITAGGFIYIAGSDLIPELHHKCGIKLSTSIWQFLAVIAGVAVMVGLLVL